MKPKEINMNLLCLWPLLFGSKQCQCQLIINVIGLLLLQYCYLVGAEGSQSATGKSTLVKLNSGHDEIELDINPGDMLNIEITNFTLSSEIEFGIIQVHSYFVPVTLSYNETLSAGFYTIGVNIGLVIYKNKQKASSVVAYVRNDNNSSKVAHILLVWRTYDSNAPIPGGCNLEQPIQTTPFLPTTFTNSVLTVKFPLASWPLNVRPASCDKTPKQYDIYQYYLPENDKSLRTVFDSILAMSSVSLAEKNGRKIEFYGSPPSKIQLANYKGTGRVIVVIARALTSSAAYVPTLSFGCDINYKSLQSSVESDCEILVGTWTKLLVSSLLFLGLFHTLLGHRFFKTHLFIHGFLSASITSFILITLLLKLESQTINLVSIVLGVLGGLILILIWCQCDMPLLAVFIGCLMAGFLFSSVLAFTPLADYWILKNNLEFWMIFASFVLVVPIILISFTHTASITCIALVGSFLSIVVLDLFLGSNLKFIIFNILHRATKHEFQNAIVDPPFQITDLLLIIVWGILTITGIVFQLWREQYRPPFPSPPIWFIPRSRRTTTIVTAADTNSNVIMASEVTPLLQESNYAYNT